MDRWAFLVLVLAVAAGGIGILGTPGRKTEKTQSQTPPQPPQPSQATSEPVDIDQVDENDYYGVLGLSMTATDEDIRAAYRRLSRLHHPDKNLQDQEAATRRSAKINAAYETLSDDNLRAHYDEERRSKRTAENNTQTHWTPQSPGSSFTSPEYWSSFFSSPRPSKSPGELFMERYGLADFHINGLFEHFDELSQSLPAEMFFPLWEQIFNDVIAKDEYKFTGRSLLAFPSFGDATTPLKAPYVKKRKNGKGLPPKKDLNTFYGFWTQFSSAKSFEWAARYDVGLGCPPQLRKMVTKENKRFVEQARQDYNRAIRSLAKAVQKRDPRRKR